MNLRGNLNLDGQTRSRSDLFRNTDPDPSKAPGSGRIFNFEFKKLYCIDMENLKKIVRSQHPGGNPNQTNTRGTYI